MLQQAWRVPGARNLPPLMVLQAAGLLALALVELGETDRARAVCADVRETAAQVEQAWGEGAAAALAMVRLAEGRLAAATDPAAAVARPGTAPSSWPSTGARPRCWWAG